MKATIAVLIAFLLALQYKLWAGDGSFAEVWSIKQAIQAQTQENAVLKERNLALEAEVGNLKSGLDAIEERARGELGLIGADEVFYQIVERENYPHPEE